MGGEPLEQDRGGVGQGDVVGHPHRRAGGHGDAFGVAAGSGAPGDAVTGREAGAGAGGQDGPGSLAAGDEGCAQRGAALALVDVLEVDARGGQFDDQGVLAGLGFRALCDGQDLRAAVGFGDDCAHAGCSSGIAMDGGVTPRGGNLGGSRRAAAAGGPVGPQAVSLRGT